MKKLPNSVCICSKSTLSAQILYQCLKKTRTWWFVWSSCHKESSALLKQKKLHAPPLFHFKLWHTCVETESNGYCICQLSGDDPSLFTALCSFFFFKRFNVAAGRVSYLTPAFGKMRTEQLPGLIQHLKLSLWDPSV